MKLLTAVKLSQNIKVQLDMKNLDPMLTCFVLKVIDHKVLLA